MKLDVLEIEIEGKREQVEKTTKNHAEKSKMSS